MSTWQNEIANAVKARGYDGAGMTREQFAFSQVCKAIEELSEVCSCFGVENHLYVVVSILKISARYAKNYFNNPVRIGPVQLNTDCIAKELADVLITLAMAAEVIGVDLESLALQKAIGDVTRGVKITTENTT